jgi:hypothetical protein
MLTSEIGFRRDKPILAIPRRFFSIARFQPSELDGREKSKRYIEMEIA